MQVNPSFLMHCTIPYKWISWATTFTNRFMYHPLLSLTLSPDLFTSTNQTHTKKSTSVRSRSSVLSGSLFVWFHSVIKVSPYSRRKQAGKGMRTDGELDFHLTLNSFSILGYYYLLSLCCKCKWLLFLNPTPRTMQKTIKKRFWWVYCDGTRIYVLLNFLLPAKRNRPTVLCPQTPSLSLLVLNNFHLKYQMCSLHSIKPAYN